MIPNNSLLATIGPLVGIGLIIAVGLFLFIFWLAMLVDLVQRPNNDKAMWAIIIIFTNVIGALLYYIVVVKKERANV